MKVINAMPSTVRFLMVGGFLGAGKTTTIGRLAAQYQAAGKRVAIVTNDQANDLVDTKQLQALGFDVGEVAGSCFCCNFDELIRTMERLSANERPDVVIAEPVGSCTDLVATVAQPLLQICGDDFEVGPYSVILKPSHGKRILERQSQGGFSPQAEYIFRKQLEEADQLIVNRMDQLTSEEADHLEQLLRTEFGDRPILRTSAINGEGFEKLFESLSRNGDNCRRILDLDYDIYAEGEAELGWLNGTASVTAPEVIELDPLLVKLVEAMRDRMESVEVEPAHLKVIAATPTGGFGVANLISSDTPVTLSLASNARTTEIDLTVNARVATTPEQLEEMVRAALQDVAGTCGASIEIKSLRALKPGRPVPTHRIVG